MKKAVLFGILAVAGVATSAQAFNVQVRFVERVGTTDTVIAGNSLTVGAGSTHRIRVQFGVFDDAAGAAPAGGFVGWNLGTQTMTGGTNSRTPGRINPFNFAPAPPGNGTPAADPFMALTTIDNTLGTQSPAWLTFGQPQPPAVIRGLNTFVSTWEFTTVAGMSNYSCTLGGNQVVASNWGIIGTPIPPDDQGNPGSITYAPQTLPPIAFTAVLNFVVPAPGTAALLGLGGLVAARRRRA